MTNQLLKSIADNTNNQLPTYLIPSEEVQALMVAGDVIGDPNSPETDENGNSTGYIPFWVTAQGMEKATAQAATPAAFPMPPVIPFPQVPDIIPAPRAAVEASATSTPSAQAAAPVHGRGQVVAAIASRERRARTSNLAFDRLNVGDYTFFPEMTAGKFSSAISKVNVQMRKDGLISEHEQAIRSYTAKPNEEVIQGIIHPVGGTYVFRTK